jgi:hypothetical protein
LVKLLYPDGSPTNAISNISEKILPGQIVPGIVSPGGILTHPGLTANADPVGTQDTLQPRRLEDVSGPLVVPTVGEFKGQIWTYPEEEKKLIRGVIFTLDSNIYNLSRTSPFDTRIDKFFKALGYRKLYFKYGFSSSNPGNFAMNYLKSKGFSIIVKNSYEVAPNGLLVVAINPREHSFTYDEFKVFKRQSEKGLLLVLGEHPQWFNYNLRLLSGLGFPSRLRPSGAYPPDTNVDVYQFSVKIAGKRLRGTGSVSDRWLGAKPTEIIGRSLSGTPIMIYTPKIPKV